MLRPLLLVLALSVGLSACNKPTGKDGKDGKKDDAPAVKLVIAPEDILTLAGSAITSGHHRLHSARAQS